MNQLFLGAAVPFAVALLVYCSRRGRASTALLVVTPLAMAVSTLWAVIPDIPRLAGMHDLYLRLSKDPRMDVFYWHYTIDLREGDSPWFAAGIVVLLACLLYATWREVALRER